MRKTTFAFLLMALATPLFAASPFAGTWKLNPDKTKYTTGAAPKELTAVIEEAGPDLHITATGANADGSAIAVKYIIPAAGGKGTVQQGDFDGITSKAMGNKVRLNSYLKGGKLLRTRRMVLSTNGKTMKTAVKGISAGGQSVEGEDYFDKQ